MVGEEWHNIVRTLLVQFMEHDGHVQCLHAYACIMMHSYTVIRNFQKIPKLEEISLESLLFYLKYIFIYE